MKIRHPYDLQRAHYGLLQYLNYPGEGCGALCFEIGAQFRSSEGGQLLRFFSAAKKSIFGVIWGARSRITPQT